MQSKTHSSDNEPKTAYIECEGKGVVTAADIQADQDIEIMNPDQVIATLNGGKDCRLAMELTITRGRGYVSADKGKSEDMPIGVLAVDAIYTPVDRVNMIVQKTLVLVRLQITISLHWMYIPMELWIQMRLSALLPRF